MYRYTVYPFPNPRKPAGPDEIETHLADTLTDTGDWQDRADCAGTDPELFFPATGESPDPARIICANCPVRRECAAYALAAQEADPLLFGVWGGLTRDERLVILGKRQPRKSTRRRTVAA